MNLSETIEALKAIREKSGYSNFLFAVKKLNRERLQTQGREKRKPPTKKEFQELYVKQGGICPGYNVPEHPLPKNRSMVAVDHINAERTDFNAASNKQLLCQDCNGRKSSKSMLKQSKETGKSFTEILGRHTAPLEDEA